MLEWMKRCKRMDTIVSDRRRWKSRCGEYAVEESEIKYGRSVSAGGVYQGYPKIFRALHKRGETWDILSEHKTKKAAQTQCEYHSEHGTLKPRNTKVAKAKRRLKKKRQAKRKAKEA